MTPAGRASGPDDESPLAKNGAFGIVHSATRANFAGVPARSNAAMADGSVRTLTAKTSAELLRALATIAGGESVPADW